MTRKREIDAKEHFKKLEELWQLLWEKKEECPYIKDQKILKKIEDAEADLSLSTEKMNELTDEVAEDVFPI